LLAQLWALVAATSGGLPVDARTAPGLVAAVIVASVAAEAQGSGPRLFRQAGVLVATVATLALLLVPRLSWTPYLWFVLGATLAAMVIAAAGAGSSAGAEALASANDLRAVAGQWLAVALGGSTVLALVSAFGPVAAEGAGAATSLPRGAGALLALVGAAGLGLLPTTRSILAHRGAAGVLADGLLPLAGLGLAARGVTVESAGTLTVLAFVALGVVGCGLAIRSAWRAEDLIRLRAAAGQANAGLAFFALAVGTPGAVAAAGLLIAVGVAGRALAGSSTRNWSRWLGWATLLGLPPLPGFLARWLLLLAVLAAGRWLLAVALAVVILVVCAVLVRQFAALAVAVPRGQTGEEWLSGFGPGLAAVVLVLCGLVPSRWWFGLLLGATATAGRVPSGVGPLGIAALLIVLLPLPIGMTALWTARRAPPPARLRRPVGGWENARRAAGLLAEIAHVVEDRYDLAVGLLLGLAVLFAFVE
jgi:hypothetical protein